MTIFKWLLAIIAIALVSYTQIKYAQADYPPLKYWRVILFGGGFVFGTVGFWALLPLTGWRELLFSAGTGGIFMGLIFAYWFPINMQNIYPRRRQNK